MNYSRRTGLGAVIIALLAAAGCSAAASNRSPRSRSGSTAPVLFTATGYSDDDGDGNIAPHEWRRKTLFASDERLVLVIDDPAPGRALRLKLTGANLKEYLFPQPIHTRPNTYQRLVWDRAIEATEEVQSRHILAEVTNEKTGELVGVCAFSVDARSMAH